MEQKFNKGQLVESEGLFVLVTGDGMEEAGYPCFGGVVVFCKEDTDTQMIIGTHSLTWSNDAFELSQDELTILKH